MAEEALRLRLAVGDSFIEREKGEELEEPETVRVFVRGLKRGETECFEAEGRGMSMR